MSKSRKNIMNPGTKTGKKRNVGPSPAKRRQLSRQGQTSYVQPQKCVCAMPTECAIRYSAALADPFKDLSEVCLPDEKNAPSLKTRTTLRGTFTVGTTGFGFVTIDPQAISNDAAFANYSLGTYAGSSVATGAGTASAANAQAPFANARFGIAQQDIQGRPVAIGLRARYIGDVLSCSGRAVGYNEPDNADLVGVTFNDILSDQSSVIRKITNGDHWTSTVGWKSNSNLYQEYLTSGSPGSPKRSLAFVVSGAPVGKEFEYQVVTYHEFTGSTFGLSISHTDLPMMSAAKNSLPPSMNVGGAVLKGVVDTILLSKNDHIQPSLQNKLLSEGRKYVYGVIGAAGADLLKSLSPQVVKLLL